MHYIHHIYFILPVFCIIYLLVKRGRLFTITIVTGAIFLL
jgi:hypothetical protein